MDARPFRPRGGENALHPLHQRHKSTGNIAVMPSVSTAGFRGPAKRAAFGDVTNVAKNLVARDDSKSSKISLTVASNHAQASMLNKENAPYVKDAFARSAQRPAALESKPKAAAEYRPEPAKKAAIDVTQSSSANLYGVDVNIPQQHNRGNAVTDQKMPLSQGPSDAAPLQPRHHKSQPQLKQQQPTLRKTQSKQLERTDLLLSDKIGLAANTGAEPSGMPAQRHRRSTAHTAYLNSLSGASAPSSRGEVNHGEDRADELTKLPGISEEHAVDSYSFKDGLTVALSDPEEWDEDDDEDYDEQDQAYTTAHSTRSRDMTSGNATTVLAPRVTARVQRELHDARLEVEHNQTAEELEEETWDVSMVAEYGEEIFEYMRELEIKMLPNPHYMEMQTEIQWSMRTVLMDWLVQVHNRFNLLPETLFLAVNYIDRFLSYKIVSIGKLQLVGATAILVASKYEEINCPSLEEIVYMVDGGYSTEDILKAERFMLSMLSFELGWPGPMSFLRRVSKADDYDLETRTLAKYFLELTIMDERFVASPPSFLAAGAHCLSRLILDKGDWTKYHIYYSEYTWSQLKSLVTMMIECCENPRQHHSAIFDKYKDKRFREASILVQHALDAGFTLPHQSSPVRVPRHALALDDSLPQLPYGNGLLVPIEG